MGHQLPKWHCTCSLWNGSRQNALGWSGGPTLPQHHQRQCGDKTTSMPTALLLYSAPVYTSGQGYTQQWGQCSKVNKIAVKGPSPLMTLVSVPDGPSMAGKRFQFSGALIGGDGRNTVWQESRNTLEQELGMCSMWSSLCSVSCSRTQVSGSLLQQWEQPKRQHPLYTIAQYSQWPVSLCLGSK